VILDFVSPIVFDKYLDNLINLALNEDIGSGDHTSLSCIPGNNIVEARQLVKDDGILAGVYLAERIFKFVDPSVKMKIFYQDGQRVKFGDISFTVSGPAQSILAVERLVLNFMQRLSGIATKTNYFVNKIRHTGVTLLDTRKTTPGLRLLEKWAVKIGGGNNHRIGLYDMILIKDNHVDYAGGVTNAVNLAKNYLKDKGLDLEIEIEIRDFNELDEVLQLSGIQRLLLDNFDIDNLKKAVSIVNHKIKTEASGGINEDNILNYAETGVDYISCGMLTNSVRSLDLSLKLFKF